MLIGSVIYPGIGPGDYLSAQAVDSQGIMPGRATITISAVNVGTIAPTGDLSFSDGSNTIVWPACRVANVSAAGGSGQGPTLTILIEDNRWTWSGGQISGRFNVPAEYLNTVPLVTFATQANFGNQNFTQVPIPPEELPIRPETAVNAQDLCKRCLKAMGVARFDVSAIDPKSYPSVEWDSEVPARALQALVERYGCRIVYRKDSNAVFICKEGVGLPLPDGPFLFDAPSLTPKPVPSKITVRSAHIRYQRRFICEWVMPEFDGSFRPANDVSYAPIPPGAPGPDWTTVGAFGWPPVGWLPNLPGNRTYFDAKALASAWMYRAYRITNRLSGGIRMAFPNASGQMVDSFNYIKQVYLLPNQVQVTTDDLKRHSPAPAQAFGKHSRFLACGIRNPASLSGTDTNASTEIIMPFSIDAEHGIIIFAQPTYILSNKKNLPAEVELLTACHFAPKSNWQFRRKDFSRSIPGGLSNLTTYVVKEELLSTVVFNYKVDGENVTETDFTENTDKMQKRSTYYLNGEIAKLVPDAADTRTYCGILSAYPDGATQQVSFEFAAGDKNKPATTVSVNTEHSVYLPNYQGRRLREEADLHSTTRQHDVIAAQRRLEKGDKG
jgi:hypothetical protein